MPLGPPHRGHAESAEAARELSRSYLDAMNADVDTAGLDIDDRRIPGPEGAPEVTVRVYRPAGAQAPVPVPAILYIHGGGFFVGSIDTELVWLHDHADELGVDTARIAVNGGSAGGGLAAGLALLARDRGGPRLCFQYLGIPELDDRLDTPSMHRFHDTPMWARPAAEKSWEWYLGAAHGRDDVSPYAAPARAADVAGLPPTYISTMEYDPLRDEGILYALKLLEAGVSVELHSFPGTFHGSAIVTGAAVSRRAGAESMTVWRRALGLDAG